MVMDHITLLPGQIMPLIITDQTTIQLFTTLASNTFQTYFGLLTSITAEASNVEEFSNIYCHNIGTLFQVFSFDILSE